MKAISRTVVAVVIILIVVIGAGSAYYFSTTTTPTTTTTPATTAGPPISNPNTLIQADSADASTFDPAAGSGIWLDENIQCQLYDRLVTMAENSAVIVPMLAESWTVSPDATTYTFQIRQNVKFANGDPLDANAVKYSLDRVVIMGFDPTLPSLLAPNMTSVLDNYTFQIKLPHPTVTILSALTICAAGIVDPKEVEAHGGVQAGQQNAWVAANSVGSGPYVLKEWDHGIQVVLERNDGYWRGPARIQEVVYKDIKEPATEIEELKRGDIDVMNNLPTNLVPQVLGDPNVVVVPTASIEVMLLWFDTTRAPFNDSRVRQAVAYAIDYDEVRTIVWQGYAVPVYGFIPKGALGYDQTLPTPTFNVTKAKQLLAEAGYPNGFTTDAVFRDEPARKRMAELVKGYLANVGITLNLHVVATPLVYSMIGAHQAPIVPMAWAGYLPVESDISWMTPFFNGTGYSHYNNPEVNSLIQLERGEPNQTKRDAIFRQIELILIHDMPAIIVAQDQLLYAQRAWVTDYNYNPAFAWWFNLYDYNKGYGTSTSTTTSMIAAPALLVSTADVGERFGKLSNT